MSKPYSPPYSLTSAIVSLVAQIGEAVGRLSAHEAAATSLRLRRINRIAGFHKANNSSPCTTSEK